MSLVITTTGPLSIGSGRRLLVWRFTVPNGVLAVIVGGSIGQWVRAIELAAPVL